jgi:peptidoglycan/LPS O-acetylase OafA/YrhL
MKRFHGIDGLRAWLAWTIVVSHIFLFTAANERFPALARIDNAAHQALLIFTIISGFVIAHLLLEKKEDYRTFIARRFLRIYPVYLICLIVGVFTTYLHLITFLPHPFGDYMPEPHLLTHETLSVWQHGVIPHLVAHLLLLQGAISNNVMDQSQYLFLGTAWSLSLEWQFYLVAPLIFLLLRDRWGRVLAAAVTVIAFVAYDQGRLGDFEAMSFLPGAGIYFAVGIATRFAVGKIDRVAVYPLAGVLVALGFIKMTHLLVPFIVWAAFVLWMLLDKPADKMSRTIKRIFSLAFDSRPARYLGELSYSTFLVHEPIMHFLGYVGIRLCGFGMMATTLLTLILSPLLILLSSMALRKYVELPAILYGKRLFKQPLRDKTV